MTNRRLVNPSWLLVAVVFLHAGVFSLTSHGQTTKPNVLFIFADDLSFDSVAACGNEEVQTPNIDTIARSGISFSHAYNMGAWGGAVCVASRTMLNTGRFVWDAEKLDLKKEQQAGRTWAQRMNTAGYETYFTGKWHVRLKPADLFDHVGHVRGGMPKQTPEGYLRPNPENDWTPWDASKGGFWEGGKHWSEVVGDEAVGFLNQAKSSDKPFFMYIAFNAPHDPRQSPKEFVDRYPREKIKVPENFLSKYPYQDEIGCGANLRDARLAPFPRTESAVQLHRQEYYAIITHMDREIGRILKALEATGKADSTYVIFTADHGLACGHHGLIGKQNMYEHSMRVPFFIRGPQIAAGKVSSEKIYLQDAMATSLAVAKADASQGIQFQNLLPIIQGQAKSKYQAIYGGYTKLQRMVIADNWKLIMYPAAKAARLYDLGNDPHEMTDLASDAKYLPKMESLYQSFQQLQKETNDPLVVEKTFGE